MNFYSKLYSNRKIPPLIFVLIIVLSNVHAQNLDSLLNNKRIYYAVNIGDLGQPRIDGIPDEAAWGLGEWQSGFTQQQPYGGKNGSETTYIKVIYDHSNLFVAIKCMDKNPSLIRDMLDRRDALTGDMTGIAIDSYYDKKTAFEFNLSAAGQKMDLKHLGDYQWDFNWDAVWDGATSKNDSGWIAEMRIPFSQLRYSNEIQHNWGMHVWRWIDRKKEEDQWQYIPLEAPAMVYLFGELKGIENIRDSRQVEFLPYTLTSLNSGVDLETNQYNLNAGLNAKIGISSDYTLDLAVNPDFGQVEADPAILNLSSFETFYEEKRPFFLEGNDIFDFSLDDDILYYSRRIGSAPDLSEYSGASEINEIPDRTTILGAAKFIGKSKKGLSVGIVNGLTTREFGKTDDGSGELTRVEVSPLSNYLASRVKKEFKEGNSSIGAFFSLVKRDAGNQLTKDLLPSAAYTGGIDMLHQWNNRNYFIELKSVASNLVGSQEAILVKQLSHNHRFQRIGADHLQVDSLADQLWGNGGLIRIGKKGGKWNFNFTGQYRSPGLNLNDMGYIGQSDYFSEKTEISYDMNKPTKWIRNYKIGLSQEARWSFGNELNMNGMVANFDITSLKLYTLNLIARYDFSFVDTREMRGGPALRNDPYYLLGFHLGSNTSKDFFARLGYYHFGSPDKSYIYDIAELRLTWLPIKRAKLSTIMNISQMDFSQQYVATLNTDNSIESIVGNIDRNTASITLRAELFLSPVLSIQYYGNPYFSVGDYSSFRRVADAKSFDTEQRFDLLNESYNPDSKIYSFDLNGNSLEFSSPDFSFLQYRSNLVFRWEYHLGSTLYFVWSHDRSDWRQAYSPIDDIAGDLFGLKGNNVFMIKLNYWFTL